MRYGIWNTKVSNNKIKAKKRKLLISYVVSMQIQSVKFYSFFTSTHHTFNSQVTNRWS